MDMKATDVEKAILYVSVLTLVAYVGFEIYKSYAASQAVSDATASTQTPASPDPLVATLGQISDLGQGPSWLTYNTPASYNMGPPVVNTQQPLPTTSGGGGITCQGCGNVPIITGGGPSSTAPFGGSNVGQGSGVNNYSPGLAAWDLVGPQPTQAQIDAAQARSTNAPLTMMTASYRN